MHSNALTEISYTVDGDLNPLILPPRIGSMLSGALLSCFATLPGNQTFLVRRFDSERSVKSTPPKRSHRDAMRRVNGAIFFNFFFKGATFDWYLCRLLWQQEFRSINRLSWRRSITVAFASAIGKPT